jgi:subtilisin family serine protease
MRVFATMMAAVAVLTLAANPSAAQSTQRVIISFKSQTTDAQRNEILKAVGAQTVKTIVTAANTDDKFVAVVADVDTAQLPATAPDKTNAIQSMMQLIPDVSKSDVVTIEKDFRVKWIESSPSFQGNQLPSLTAVMGSLPKFQLTGVTAAAMRPESTWGIDKMAAPAAWQYTKGAKIRVAVIDTGIDSRHPDLAGQVDGGYNAITKSASGWRDDQGHGTHVAGTIAALKDGKGVVGVAPEARLYSVKVLDADGSGSLSDVIDGIIWAAENNMHVANMSLGSAFPSDTMQRALRYAKAKGVVVVAAAGNSGGAVGYPGGYPEVIGVSASDFEDKLAVFSSRGPEVDLIAPGVHVVSTKMGGGYVSYSGTSMAAPHVAGAVALAMSQGWVGLDGPDGVMSQLQKAAIDIGLSTEQQGAGMVNLLCLVGEDSCPRPAAMTFASAR